MNQDLENGKAEEEVKGITRISVQGFKSLYEECSIEVRPLTILAGANSSGKSSIMQPLLLMKQTLEAPYDPGALLLNGANVKFNLTKQLLTKIDNDRYVDSFSIDLKLATGAKLINFFTEKVGEGFEISKVIYKSEHFNEISFSPEISTREIIDLILNIYGQKHSLETIVHKDWFLEFLKWKTERKRCFLNLECTTMIPMMGVNVDSENQLRNLSAEEERYLTPWQLFNSQGYIGIFEEEIYNLIHVPGLRGSPERTYKTTAIGKSFLGTFDNYVASVINHWQKQKINDLRLKELEKNLQLLGLTQGILAERIDDTQVELRVGRLLGNQESSEDFVSIADVGFGVSQVLPVLVALLVAEPGQLVYIEQPEIHLHPRAQTALAQVFADAANRGVRVVVETHSELLILAIQALVAEEKLAPEKVKLHWFTRQENGATKVSSADLDEAGAFGDWPEDFGDVSLSLENRYLTAAEAHLWKR